MLALIVFGGPRTGATGHLPAEPVPVVAKYFELQPLPGTGELGPPR